MAIRDATEADISAMADIMAAGGKADDPFLDYLHPYRLQYPGDEWDSFRNRSAKHMIGNADCHSMVCEAPSHEDPTVRKVVGFSCWQLPGTFLKAKDSAASNSQDESEASTQVLKRHVHQGRLTAYKTGSDHTQKNILNARYGDRQLGLETLICHPDYQRRGFGTKLCDWGLRKAKAEGLTITVISSPMGLHLYRRLGFRDVGSFRTQLDGEEEFLQAPVLVLPPEQIRIDAH